MSTVSARRTSRPGSSGALVAVDRLHAVDERRAVAPGVATRAGRDARRTQPSCLRMLARGARWTVAGWVGWGGWCWLLVGLVSRFDGGRAGGDVCVAWPVLGSPMDKAALP